MLQPSTWLPCEPLMLHAPPLWLVIVQRRSPPAGSVRIVQLMPALSVSPGSGSLSTTSRASPAPGALVTSMEKPIREPALTVGLSAVLVTVSDGVTTVVFSVLPLQRSCAALLRA